MSTKPSRKAPLSWAEPNPKRPLTVSSCWTNIPRVVVVDLPGGYKDSYPDQGGLCHNQPVLLLGPVTNKPGQVAVADSDGKVTWGWPVEHFREAGEEEIPK